jgi:hypothetical protein
MSFKHKFLEFNELIIIEKHDNVIYPSFRALASYRYTDGIERPSIQVP